MRGTLLISAPAVLILGFLVVFGPVNAAPQPPLVVALSKGPLASQPATRDMLAEAAQVGSLPVIVGLDTALADEDALSVEEARAQELRLNQAQDALLARTAIARTAGIKRFESVPFVAMRVTPAQLGRLLYDRHVVSIEVDRALNLFIGENIKLVKAPELWDQGITGVGEVIAVLDTGVDPHHPMLKDKVVAQACYSSIGTGIESLCPGGALAATGRASGENCPVTIAPCHHGTMVASIAAGDSLAHHSRGVAPSANIISIKVVSKFTSAAQCDPLPAPCAKPLVSDLGLGLDHVYKLRKRFSIAAVNISLGDSLLYPTSCDFVYGFSIPAAVANLRKAGIAMVAATGNQGQPGQTSFPSCMTDAIAVAASTPADLLWEFSNYNWNVKFFAPGKDIIAAVPPGSPCAGGGKYCTDSGTSLATPHVSGAFALLKQARPAATIANIVGALNCTGSDIEYLGLHRPRISLAKAYDELLGPDAPEKFDFDSAADADSWSQDLGQWQVTGGAFQSTTFPGDGNWIMASHEYCSSSFQVRALVQILHPETSDDSAAGLLVASDIGKTRPAVAATGYLLSFGIHGIHVTGLKNEPFKSAVGISGAPDPLCTLVAGVDFEVPHILQVTVEKDGFYRFSYDGQKVCEFSASSSQSHMFPPPAKIAIVASRPIGGEAFGAKVLGVVISPRD